MIAKKHTNEKDIDSSVFYLFHILNGDIVLFDADMSYPLRYGKINTITPILRYFKTKLGAGFKLYQFNTNEREGFKKDNSPIRIDASPSLEFPSIGFPTFPVRKFIPKTNRSKLYYHFKLSPSTHILFDEELDSSIQYGSKMDVSAQYRHMPEDATVYYFEKNPTYGFKMKMAIKKDKTKKTDVDVKETAKEQTPHKNNT